MHAISHQYHLNTAREVACAFDRAKVDAIEICHADGIVGSTFNYGSGGHDEVERIAEAHVSKQHIEAARELGMDTVTFLKMAHMAPVEKLMEQALPMEGDGAECVYVTVSTGSLQSAPHSVRLKALCGVLKPETEIGLHTHCNLTLGVSNAVAGIETGAMRVDASLAGAENAQLGALIAVLDRMGIEFGCDLHVLMDAVDDLVRPLQDRPVRVERESLSLGYAGVYSSFLRHAENASKLYGIDAPSAARSAVRKT